MNIKDEHTSRLWTFIMKGEIMAFELDEDELIATRVNNKTASWKEVEEYIEKYYVKKDKIKEKMKELEHQAEEVKNHYKGTYACLDEYLNAKAKIQGFKELLQEGDK